MCQFMLPVKCVKLCFSGHHLDGLKKHKLSAQCSISRLVGEVRKFRIRSPVMIISDIPVSTASGIESSISLRKLAFEFGGL